MVNSFGFYVYNETKGRISNPNLGDPYFKYSDNDSNVWTKWTGYILPHYMADSNNDSQPDSQFDETNGVDWKWPRYAKYVALRFGSCGNGSQNSNKGIVRRQAVHTLSPTYSISDSVESISDDTKLASITDFFDRLHVTDESNTGPPTAVPTAPPTSPPTEPSTSPPTEPSTSPPTEPSTSPPTAPSTLPSSVTPAVNKTWYLNVSVCEFESLRRPEHNLAWTFNISDFREWASKPNDTNGN